MDKIKEVEIFEEILASDQMLSYQGVPMNIASQLGDNPTIIFHHLMFNPWLAMAIYDDMIEKDGAIFSNLETRSEGVLSKPHRVIPASDESQDKKIAEFIEETITEYFGSSNLMEDADEFSFNSFLMEALEAISRGVSIGETIYAEARDRIYIKEVKFKPQQLFAFGDTALAGYSTNSMMYPQTGKLRFRTGVSSGKYALGSELPEYKFFVFSSKARFGNRWGNPLMRKLYWQSWIKRNSLKQWLRYIEKGSGVVIAKYNDGADKAEQNEAVEAATAIQEESAVAVAKKFLIEVHEMVRNIGSSHKELVDDFCNAEIARIILGQTLTSRGSDGGGSRALGEVHERVQANKVESDSIALMGAVNKRIIKPLVYFNFGPDAKCPKWVIEYEPQEDQDSRATRYGVLKNDVGIDLSKTQIREEFQVQEPVNDEDRISAGGKTEVKTDPLDDDVITEFAEKKTLKMRTSGNNLEHKSNLKTGRFRKLRPSMIQFSSE